MKQVDRYITYETGLYFCPQQFYCLNHFTHIDTAAAHKIYIRCYIPDIQYDEINVDFCKSQTQFTIHVHI